MDNMFVVNFASTGHVLGAVTLSTKPDSPPTVEQVASSGITLRNVHGIEARLTVPPSELAITEVEFKRDALYTPYLYAIEENPSGKLPRLEQRYYYDNGAPPAPDPPVVDVDGSQITVTLPATAASLTTVIVQISGENLSEPIVRSEDIAEGFNTTGPQPLVLKSGEYAAAIFVPGYATVLQPVSI
jgi:hypothetical protein